MLVKCIKQDPCASIKTLVSRIQRDLLNTRTTNAIQSRLWKIRAIIRSESQDDSKDEEAMLNDSETDSDTSDLEQVHCRDRRNASRANHNEHHTTEERANSMEANRNSPAIPLETEQLSQNSMTTDPMMKQRAISSFEKLSRFYAAENNQFDLRIINQTLSALRECDGRQETILGITLNPIDHFENKIAEFERKHGAIDFEMEDRIIKTLQSHKESCLKAVQQIDDALQAVKSRMRFGRESELQEIAGCDLQYLQNIMMAINAPKIRSNPSPKLDVIEISDSESVTSHCNQSDIEERRDHRGDDSRDRDRCSGDDRNRSRSRSRSRNRERGWRNGEIVGSRNPFCSDLGSSYCSDSSVTQQTTNASKELSAFPPEIESVFEVERIADTKYVEGERQYLVQWKGFEDPTWEPIQNLSHCTEIIEKYHAAMNANETTVSEDNMIDTTGMPQLERQSSSQSKMNKHGLTDIIVISDEESEHAPMAESSRSSASDMDIGNGTDSE